MARTKIKMSGIEGRTLMDLRNKTVAKRRGIAEKLARPFGFKGRNKDPGKTHISTLQSPEPSEAELSMLLPGPLINV